MAVFLFFNSLNIELWHLESWRANRLSWGCKHSHFSHWMDNSFNSSFHPAYHRKASQDDQGHLPARQIIPISWLYVALLYLTLHVQIIEFFTTFKEKFLKATRFHFPLHHAQPLPLYRLKYLLLQICSGYPLLFVVRKRKNSPNHISVEEVIIL